MSASNLDKTKATSFDEIYSRVLHEPISRAKSRSLVTVNEIAKEPGAFPRNDLLIFKPENVPERAHSGQIMIQNEEDNPLSSMNACVWMATSKYLPPHQKESFKTHLEMPPNTKVKKITEYFDQHLADTIHHLQFTKNVEVYSFKINKVTPNKHLSRAQEGPLILRLYHKTFPRTVDIHHLFQWVILDRIDTIEDVVVADIKDPEDGLQYFVPLQKLIARIDYDAIHYRVKETPQIKPRLENES